MIFIHQVLIKTSLIGLNSKLAPVAASDSVTDYARGEVCLQMDTKFEYKYTTIYGGRMVSVAD